MTGYKELHEQYRNKLDDYFKIDNNNSEQIYDLTLVRALSLSDRPEKDWPTLCLPNDPPEGEMEHNYQRNEWASLKQCSIMLDDVYIGSICAKPHPKVVIVRNSNLGATKTLAKNLFIKLLHEEYPKVKVLNG